MKSQKMARRLLAGGLALLMIIALAGCGRGTAREGETGENGENAAAEQTNAINKDTSATTKEQKPAAQEAQWGDYLLAVAEWSDDEELATPTSNFGQKQAAEGRFVRVVFAWVSGLGDGGFVDETLMDDIKASPIILEDGAGNTIASLDVVAVSGVDFSAEDGFSTLPYQPYFALIFDVSNTVSDDDILVTVADTTIRLADIPKTTKTWPNN
jgi:hypothetical protein